MSWSIRTAGEKSDVLAVVERDGHVPIEVRAIIRARVEAMPEPNEWQTKQGRQGVFVQTHGHIDPEQGDIHIEVRRIVFGPPT